MFMEIVVIGSLTLKKGKNAQCSHITAGVRVRFTLEYPIEISYSER